MNEAIKERLHIRNLRGIFPDLKSDKPLGNSIMPKGDVSYLNFDETMKYISIMDFKPNMGIRGNLYHKEKKKIIFVVSGEIRGIYWLPEHPEETTEVQHKRGDLITILPGLGHGFEALDYSTTIEMSPSAYDASDNFKLADMELTGS